MRKIFYFVAMVAFSVFSTACHKNDDIHSCALSLHDTAPADVTVTYTATVLSGSGTANSIAYQAGTDNVAVTNPALPFTATVALKKGAAINIAAVVTVTGGGKISAVYGYSDGGLNASQGQQLCGQ